LLKIDTPMVRQVREVVHPAVAVGQAKQVDEEVDRGQDPGEQAVSGEVAVEGAEGAAAVPPHVEQPTGDVPEQYPGDEVDRQGERDDPLEQPRGGPEWPEPAAPEGGDGWGHGAAPEDDGRRPLDRRGGRGKWSELVKKADASPQVPRLRRTTPRPWPRLGGAVPPCKFPEP